MFIETRPSFPMRLADQILVNGVHTLGEYYDKVSAQSGDAGTPQIRIQGMSQADLWRHRNVLEVAPNARIIFVSKRKGGTIIELRAKTIIPLRLISTEQSENA